MVKANIRDFRRYCVLHPQFKEAFARLEEIAKNFSEGTITENGIKYMCQSYLTSSPKERKLEAHRKYVDIQFVVEGAERMLCGRVSDFKSAEPYDEEKDVEFFEGELPDSLDVGAGEFAVFFPEDLHQPGCFSRDAPAPVKKVIVKLPV